MAGAFGVKGEVRITAFTADPMALFRYRDLKHADGAPALTLTTGRPAKGGLVAEVREAKDRNQAEALRGLRLFLARSALPQTEADEYYHADLIGLEAVLGDGTPVGHVRAVHDFGAGDTLELVRPGAPSVMVPFTRAVVPGVELTAGRLVLDPPPGLLDGNEE